MTALIVIPARWGSTRFPGKPLARIAGYSLLERVIAIGRRAAALLDKVEVVVATDDDRVMDEASALGCPAVMTSSALINGSERALSAASLASPAPDHVVNLQGDAPFIPAETVAAVLLALRTGTAGCATPVVSLAWAELDALREHKRRAPLSGTTCVRASDGRALWFSKAVLPSIRDEATARRIESSSPVWRHLGLYGYTLETLRRFTEAPPSVNETLEGLEQLRLLELGITIQTVAVPSPPIAMGGIDEPADVEEAERLIAATGDPFRP